MWRRHLVNNLRGAYFRIKGEDNVTYHKHIWRPPWTTKPHMTMDDGADLVATIHKDRRDSCPASSAVTEETTTGVIRLRAMAADGMLQFPVIAVNDAMTSISSITVMAPANPPWMALSAQPTCSWLERTSWWPVTAWCGRGLASRARGNGLAGDRYRSGSAESLGSRHGWLPGNADDGSCQKLAIYSAPSPAISM